MIFRSTGFAEAVSTFAGVDLVGVLPLEVTPISGFEASGAGEVGVSATTETSFLSVPLLPLSRSTEP